MLPRIFADRMDETFADAELVTLCGRMCAVNRAIDRLATRDVSPCDVAAYQNSQREWRELAGRASTIQAHTIEGVQARVAAMGPLVGDLLRCSDANDGAERAMIEALLSDLLGEW